MKNNWDFEDYEIIKELKSNHNIALNMFIIFIGVIVIVMSKLDFYIYDNKLLIKENDNYSFIIPSKKISFFENNRDIYINQKKYNYDIVEIDSNYQNINDTIYQNVYIKIDNYKTNAILTECSFLKEKTTILNKVFKLITGGRNEKNR